MLFWFMSCYEKLLEINSMTSIKKKKRLSLYLWRDKKCKKENTERQRKKMMIILPGYGVIFV